ncbi:hypothetical protein D3C81_2089230 [compost metagenome]
MAAFAVGDIDMYDIKAFAKSQRGQITVPAVEERQLTEKIGMQRFQAAAGIAGLIFQD